MLVIEDRCCDCAAGGYPCLGNSCELRHVKVHYCDRCECGGDIYEFDGEELCKDCIIDAAMEMATLIEY